MVKFNPGEKIYLVKKRHWIVLTFQLLPFVLFSLLILFVILFLLFREISWPQFFLEIFPQFSQLQLKFILLFFFSLVLPIFWTVIFLILTYYYLTYWIVTNQRTIYVRLAGFFNLSSSSVSHDRVQDIVLIIKGILPTIFHFGNIQIQTAGEVGKFIFEEVPEPEIIKQVILEAQRDYLKELKKI